MSLLERTLSDLARPRWEGAPGFDKAWNGCVYCAQNLGVAKAYREWACEILQRLATCHVLTIDSSQALALPPIESSKFGDAADFTLLTDAMRNVSLPFEHTFIDTGPIRRPDYDPARSGEILGAIVTRDPHPLSEVDEPLSIIPFFVDRRVSELGLPLHHMIEHNPSPLVWNPNIECVPSADVDQMARDAGLTREKFREGIIMQGYDLAERPLAVLQWLESVNVEIVEPTITRQVRRNAQRQGKQIAKVVKVHISESRRRAIARGGTSNYSHQFEVRAHYAFQPETAPMSRAAPEKLSYVPERGGYFRRTWCPAYIKGPIDKPFVPKTRHLVASAT
jgi:hypothetical protein